MSRWRNVHLSRDSDDDQYVPALGCAVEKVGIDFAHHTGTLFVPRGARPNADAARRFFRRLDGLNGRVVLVSEQQVRILWQERLPCRAQRGRSASAARKENR